MASSAAMAEVTIYGTLDAGLASTSVSGAQGSGTYLSGAGGYSYGNNMGFKGSEDLGGGLKANFQLETGFNLNSGQPNNGGAGHTFDTANIQAGTATALDGAQPIFNRVSTIGLSGDFGSVNLGQQLSPFIGAALSGVLGNGHFGVNRLILGGSAAYPAAAVGGNASVFPFGGFFIPNAVSYSLPAGLPVSGTLLTSTKTGTQGGGGVANPVDSERYTAFSLSAPVGPLNLAFAHESRANTTSGYTLSGTTNFGELQLAANYMSIKLDPLVTTGAATPTFGSLALGAGYNITPEFNASVQWARNSDAMNGTTPAITAFTGKYTLSKRTSIYASYLRASEGAQSNYDYRANGIAPAFNQAGGATAADSNNTTVVGIAHSF